MDYNALIEYCAQSEIETAYPCYGLVTENRALKRAQDVHERIDLAFRRRLLGLQDLFAPPDGVVDNLADKFIHSGCLFTSLVERMLELLQDRGSDWRDGAILPL